MASSFILNQLFLFPFCLFCCGLFLLSETVNADNFREKRAAVGHGQGGPAVLNQNSIFNNQAEGGQQQQFKQNFPKQPLAQNMNFQQQKPLAANAGGGRMDHPVKTKKKGQVKLGDTVQCAADVHRFCADKKQLSNFMILDCLQDDEKTNSDLSEECHNYLWWFKFNLTRDDFFDHPSNEACGEELQKLPECASLEKNKGLVIPCLIEHYDDITVKTCRTFLNKMASIIFSDYRFMEHFIQDCNSDILKYKCGRMEGDEDDAPHSQGKTIRCLKQHKLEKKCKKAILRVAEIQSDDYHLDRPLYYACKGDRESLCADVASGQGAVFKCLYEHIGSKKLTEKCREKLEERQELIAEDVKADKTFYTACQSDIKKYKCTHKDSQDTDDDSIDLSRSTVLLCLERAQNEDKKVQPECLQEMYELRSELMQDYKLTPELVSACQAEVQAYCGNLDRGGNTLHCLMKKIVHNDKVGKDKAESFGNECKAEVAKLLHLANPGSDIRVDVPLQRACGDVITQACSDRKPGQGDIITCLLENLDHEEMTDDCEDHLLEIQYFAVRDFKLDHHLFKQCRKDVKSLCDNTFQSATAITADQGPLIFSCLHRLMRSKDPNQQKPTRACIHEVRRVTRERSMRISLMPEVEEACRMDLAELCSDEEEQDEKGAEMECLQTNLEDLRPECHEQVSKFTEEESEDLQLDRILMKACTPMIKQFCGDLLVNDAMPNEVLECLINHKTHIDMDHKCAVGIEHHQLIALKDFRFNHKFREACQNSVKKFCSNKKTKYDVVACLSEHVRNDTLTDNTPRIDKGCRKQLRFELLQRGESIKLDPKLEAACKADVNKFCHDSSPGEAEVLECLKKHKKRLSHPCHALLFVREQDEAAIADYSLLHACKKMIKKHCDLNSDEAEILDCLKEHKDDTEFDERCRSIVIRRQLEHAKDIRLNPHVQKACYKDIPKFCSGVFDRTKDEELEGVVINCLKKQFTNQTKPLSRDCQLEIESRIKKAALDISLNPVVMKVCEKDIRHSCRKEHANVEHMSIDDNERIETFGTGAIIECLKRNFQTLMGTDCKREIAFMIAESRVDIHDDPLLQSTCQKDLITLCQVVTQGQGRQMSCLLAQLESNPEVLTRNCKEMLQRRKTLWEYAAQVAPADSFSEIYEQMSASPARNYFMAVLFTAIGIIFIVGITCGRVTKRVRAEVKNK